MRPLKRGKKRKGGQRGHPGILEARHIWFVPLAVVQSGPRQWTSNSGEKETDSSRPFVFPSSPRTLVGSECEGSEVLDKRGPEPAWAGESQLSRVRRGWERIPGLGRKQGI